ncbi:GDSL-type esterase/lipase family protein [Carboxylicivirga sp. N1Y90]|uniref:GDSL-type esterase/lipase family protein n=1 Tax=Carboxylicivirga fragile TaxID=3417571 RepID=UPI003D340AB3|nr:sialate O-acetylesterase [Marinilabiliaceae bacterium N1Y90]
MKNNKILVVMVLMLISQWCIVDLHAQSDRFSTYYHQRKSLFEELPNTKNEIIFLGNSITDGGEWIELLNNKKVRNRGISGDVTDGVLYRLDEVTESKPKKVFLLIGVNDLARGTSSDTIVSKIKQIALQIGVKSPNTQVYIQSILPVNPVFKKFSGHCSKTEEIISINKGLKIWCQGHSSHYIDLFSHFKNEDDNLMQIKYTNDGLHLTGAGYFLWADIIKPYIK